MYVCCIPLVARLSFTMLVIVIVVVVCAAVIVVLARLLRFMCIQTYVLRACVCVYS